MDRIEMFDIWMPFKQGEGNAVKEDGTQMKLVARIVGGVVVILAKDFVLQKRDITDEDAKVYLEHKI